MAAATVSRVPAPRGWLVRMDPELYVDVELHDACDRSALFAYLSSLFYLAETDGPSGVYPAAEVDREFGNDANQVALQLLNFGLWIDAGLGYLVVPHAGWRVIPEKRIPVPAEVRQAVYARDGWRCVFCGSRENLALDHVYPWSLGGPDTEDNLQTLCRSCNSRKGTRT